MAQFCFRLLQDDRDSPSGWHRALPAQGANATPISGWHESSFDLLQGLDVADATPADVPLSLWLALTLGEPPQR